MIKAENIRYTKDLARKMRQHSPKRKPELALYRQDVI